MVYNRRILTLKIVFFRTASFTDAVYHKYLFHRSISVGLGRPFVSRFANFITNVILSIKKTGVNYFNQITITFLIRTASALH